MAVDGRGDLRCTACSAKCVGCLESIVAPDAIQCGLPGVRTGQPHPADPVIQVRAQFGGLAKLLLGAQAQAGLLAGCAEKSAVDTPAEPGCERHSQSEQPAGDPVGHAAGGQCRANGRVGLCQHGPVGPIRVGEDHLADGQLRRHPHGVVRRHALQHLQRLLHVASGRQAARRAHVGRHAARVDLAHTVVVRQRLIRMPGHLRRQAHAQPRRELTGHLEIAALELGERAGTVVLNQHPDTAQPARAPVERIGGLDGGKALLNGIGLVQPQRADVDVLNLHFRQTESSLGRRVTVLGGQGRELGQLIPGVHQAEHADHLVCRAIVQVDAQHRQAGRVRPPDEHANVRVQHAIAGEDLAVDRLRAGLKRDDLAQHSQQLVAHVICALEAFVRVDMGCP